MIFAVFCVKNLIINCAALMQYHEVAPQVTKRSDLIKYHAVAAKLINELLK